MSLVIFGDLFSFPEGSAATNRVYTYAKGFMENGVKVYVICFNDDYLEAKEGIIDGIKYYQPLAQKKRSNSFFVRRIHKTLKYYNALRVIKKINKEDKIIAINSWSNLQDTHVFAKFLCLVTGSKLLLEISEHPMRYYNGGWLNKKKGELLYKLEAGIADGLLCISHFLVNFYKSNNISNKKLFLVPSTVDPERFNVKPNKPVDYSYIGYFGSLTFDRDDIGLLIRAFEKFSKINEQINLVLGGFCSNEERTKIIKLIHDLGITERVNLLGYLSRDEIIRYVAHADVLVMVRANDLQSQASYPSKLSEFMASGKPVISVNVGEISLYLTDGKDAYLIEPGNEEQLFEKIKYAFKNPEISQDIGRNGRALTETIFNYKYQAKRMLEFIDTID